MVGETRIYQGQRVQVIGVVNGDEVVIQLPDGSRIPVYRSTLEELPKPASNRPIITKGGEETLPPAPPAGEVPPADPVPPVAPPSDPAPAAPEAVEPPPAPPAQ